MSNNNNTFEKKISDEISLLFDPIFSAVQSESSLQDLFFKIGWDLDKIGDLPIAKIKEIFSRFVTHYNNIISSIDNPPASLTEFKELLKNISMLFETLSELPKIFDRTSIPYPPQWDQIAQDLISFLVINYLEEWHPVLYNTLVMLTVIRTSDDAPISNAVLESGKIIRAAQKRPILQLDQIAELLKRPINLFKKEYLPNGISNVSDAKSFSDKIFPRLATLLDSLGFSVVYGLKGYYGLDFGNDGNEIGSRMLTIFKRSDEGSSFGITLTISPEDQGNLGLVILPFGDLQFSQILDSWLFNFDLSSEIEGFAIGSDKPTLPSTLSDSGIKSTFSAIKLPSISNSEDPQPIILIGSSKSTRLEIRQLKVIGEISLNSSQQEYGLIIDIKSASLVVSAVDGDNFTKKIFSNEDLRIEFDLAIGWSNIRGLYFKGGTESEVRVPINKSFINGSVIVDSLYLSLIAGERKINIIVSTTVRLSLGPITAVVERIGLQTILSFPSSLGNLGPANVDLDFKLPDGLGIAINSQGVKGGGFIRRKEDQYAGVIDLDLRGFAVQAIAILDTNRDISFAFAIFATFEPAFQLGAGWKITKIGGFLGFNRTLSHKDIATGIQTGALDTVLFPANVIQNAPSIIDNFTRIFPSQNEQYLIGPAVRIAYGSPTFITGDVAVILEFPNPFQISLLGKITARIPFDDPIIEINLGILGSIDFTNGRAGFYGTLFNSRILNFTLSGDMAMAASWGAEKNFIFSIGGFHPRFTPPSNFPPFGAPPLRRLTVSFSNNVILQSYIALTSNTFQIGARIDARFSSGKAQISGFLGFDALIQFSPLYYIVDIAGEFVAKYKKYTLASIRFACSLEGPNPHRIKGKAVFSILWWDISVDVDARFGSEKPPIVSKIDPLPLLVDALQQNESWKANFPEWANLGVTLTESSKEITTTGDDNNNENNLLILHPLGTLTVSQKVVPLNHTLTKFGAADPIGHVRFEMTGGTIGTSNVSALPYVRDYFAPAQFSKYSNAESLSLKSFDQMDSGVQFNLSDELEIDYGDAIIPKVMEFETQVIIGKDEPLLKRENSPATNTESEVFQIASNAYQASIKNNKKIRYNMKKQPYRISLREEKSVIVDKGLSRLEKILDDIDNTIISPDSKNKLKIEFGIEYNEATAINKLYDLLNIFYEKHSNLYEKYKDELRIVSLFEVV